MPAPSWPRPVNVFELKTQAQLAGPAGRKAAAAQVAAYVTILAANKVDAVPGDPRKFTELAQNSGLTRGEEAFAPRRIET